MSQVVGKTRLAYARSWHHLDIGSDPRALGRVASSIALTLMGKHKPIFDPSTDCGDYVVATNCAALHTTGKKRTQKLYRGNYIGGDEHAPKRQMQGPPLVKQLGGHAEMSWHNLTTL
jgi:ribosomal protein L13